MRKFDMTTRIACFISCLLLAVWSGVPDAWAQNARMDSMPDVMGEEEANYGAAQPAEARDDSPYNAQATDEAAKAQYPNTAHGNEPKSKENAVAESRIPVFGSQLFNGNFVAGRDQSMNPDYVIAIGDRLSVQTWGTVAINDVFVVDGQGNIFLPDIGPVQVQGVANRDLTGKVRDAVRKVYRDGFKVYTNVLNAKPVNIMVTGWVSKPGRYAGVPGDSIFYYLDRAGGMQADVGSYRNVEVVRRGKVVERVDLYRFLLDGTMPDIQFQDGDSVVVRQTGPRVTLLGNVSAPYQLEFKPGVVTGQEALEIIPEAVNAMQISVEGIRHGQNVKESLTLVEFKEFTLQDGDVVTLMTNPASDKILVYIEGQYEGPNVLAVRNGTRLLDVLHRIPVDSNIVDAKAIHVRRESVKVSQRHQIEQSLQRLEKETMLAMSETLGESSIRTQEAKLVQDFVVRASRIEPQGKVVTSRNGEQQNILLEPGDVIVIPRRSNVVEIAGEVFMSQAVVYQPEYGMGDYIEKAGGYGQRADKANIILLKSNGEAMIGSGGDIEPGDKILVPPKADKKLFQNAMDFTQVVYQIAIAAGVLAGL